MSLKPPQTASTLLNNISKIFNTYRDTNMISGTLEILYLFFNQDTKNVKIFNYTSDWAFGTKINNASLRFGIFVNII